MDSIFLGSFFTLRLTGRGLLVYLCSRDTPGAAGPALWHVLWLGEDGSAAASWGEFREVLADAD